MDENIKYVKIKVLIVNDSIFTSNLIAKLLDDGQTETILANDAKEGFKFALEMGPDVILLDMVLPDMDGYEVCRRMKSIGKIKNVPIIFITSNNSETSIVNGFEAGATDYIAKPFNSAELKARVRCHAENKLMADKLHQANRRLEKLMEEIRIQGYRDALTEIYNRKYFLEGMAQWKKQMKESGEVAGLLLIDVDYFKDINDTYGHNTGDYVLKTVAKLIKCGVSADSVVGRWGGDEFLVLMFDTSEKEVVRTGNQIVTGIREFPFTYEEYKISVSVTVGTSRFLPDLDIDGNLKLADKALYVGKKRGRNCCVGEGEE